MSDMIIPVVEVPGIAGQKRLHDRRASAGVCLDKQMEVVGHQAIGIELEGPRFFQELQFDQEPAAIRVAQENILLIIASSHDVVDGAWEVDSWGSSHIYYLYD
ncbi:MAG: hypothetical protein AAB320_03635 [Elusimicrobiota bacterium]